MSIKMVMVLTSLHMHLTCQEKEQVDAISMNISGKEVMGQDKRKLDATHS